MNGKIKKDNLKICFVSLSSYPLLKGINSGYVGGAEMQQVEIAKELKKRGHEISFMTYGKNNDNKNSLDRIQIFSVYDRNHAKDYSILKKAFFIYKKMKEVDADIYFCRAGSPGISSIFCKLNKKILIKSIATDAEVARESLIKKNWFIDYLLKIANWLDLKLSDTIVSQSEFQKLKLKERFNLNSTVIKNSLDVSLQFNKKSSGDYLLWVGTIRSIKQPELLLKVAQYFPDYKFVIIGGKGENSEYFKKIKNTAEKIKNINFKGFVSPQEIYYYYQKAILLINTSKTEGFPNIFLEAWLHFIPVVSLNVDPDEIISRYKLGFHSKTFEQMLINIETLLKDKELLEMMGKNGRKYVEENHDIRKAADQYEILIQDMIKNS